MSIHKIQCLAKLMPKHRHKVVEAAKQTLTEYLHSTRALPYVVAENVSSNSTGSILSLISRVHLNSSSDFSSNFEKFFRYNPVNEMDFFYESLGIHVDEVKLISPAKGIFLSENMRVLEAACELYAFGFPWNKLGILFKEKNSIFEQFRGDLVSKLNRFSDYGFAKSCIVGMCLAIPSILSGEFSDEDVELMFKDLKSLSLNCSCGCFMNSNIDSCYELFKKIKVFYDLGCKKGNVGELFCKSERLCVGFPVEYLIEKSDFFCRFDVCKQDVGLLILERTENMDFDLENGMFSVWEILQHFGMKNQELKCYSEKFPYVFGRNKIANLPNVMKAMNLSQWFFDKLKNGNEFLLPTYKLSDYDDQMETEFKNNLQKIQDSRYPHHKMKKVAFMHELGFGRNSLTLDLMGRIYGNNKQLRERIYFLLNAGLDYSKLLSMIATSPKVANTDPKMMEQKLEFLHTEIGSSIDYLYVFPGFLRFSLDRIIPRYRFLKWFADKGFTCSYKTASIVATSEKRFIDKIHRIHPPAVKHYLEGFLIK